MLDIEKIFSSGETKDIEIEFEGSKLSITVRDLGWSEKNQILSQCFNYQQDGGISFNFDRYNKLALEKIIVRAPWGETNHIFFNRIKSSFGAILEKLVPNAFEGIQQNDFFVQK